MSAITLYDIPEFEVKTIANKDLVIFDSHNLALPIWGEYASRIKKPLHLVSFDTHTDTHPAFCSYLGKKGMKTEYNKEKVMSIPQVNEYISQYHYRRDDYSLGDVFCFAEKIPNTEQILTGIALDYLCSYTIINHGESKKANYEDYDRLNGLDATYLGDFDKRGIQIRTPLALDFDLDYFTSPSIFDEEFELIIHPLIRAAEVISIAREPYYFENSKIKKDYTWREAQDTLLSIINDVLVDS